MERGEKTPGRPGLGKDVRKAEGQSQGCACACVTCILPNIHVTHPYQAPYHVLNPMLETG